MTSDLPPLITDPDHYHEGYLYLPHWDDYQHRDALRSGPPLKWHKTLTAQLDHPEYLALSWAERGLLCDLRMLVSRAGQGRVMFEPRSIQGRLGVFHSRFHVYMIRLIQAGFLEVRAGKMPATCQHPAGTEERRGGGAPTAHTPTRRKRAPAGIAEGDPATQNGHRLVAGVELDQDTIRAMQNGYRPGTLTDQQIDAIHAELTEEEL